MNIPEKYKQIILNEKDPAQIYRRCISDMAKEHLDCNYSLTEAIVYATEISYALAYLKQNQRPKSFLNFADLGGDAHKKLFSITDKIENLNIAFIGSGPFPVSAFQIRDQYPEARIVCVDNNIVAHLIGKALSEKFNMNIEFEWKDAIEVDYSAFNAVVVAAMINDKTELVDKILKTSKSTVIVRGAVEIQNPRVHPFLSTFKDNGAITFCRESYDAKI
jgi:hypothetical protein